MPRKTVKVLATNFLLATADTWVINEEHISQGLARVIFEEDVELDADVDWRSTIALIGEVNFNKMLSDVQEPLSIASECRLPPLAIQDRDPLKMLTDRDPLKMLCDWEVSADEKKAAWALAKEMACPSRMRVSADEKKAAWKLAKEMACPSRMRSTVQYFDLDDDALDVDEVDLVDQPYRWIVYT